MKKINKIAIIIAGGVGARMGQDIPKQFLNVGEKPVIVYTLEAFQKHPDIDGIIVVCIDGWHEILKSYAKQFGITKLVSVVSGGASGHESIRCGLDEANKLYPGDSIVLIHDAIRPMVSEEIISDNIVKCLEHGNATPIVPCTTVAMERTTEEYSDKIIDRDKICITQTPQSFILKEILDAHKEAKKKGITGVASCSLYIALGRKVYYSMGSETNIKLTTPGDIQIFKALLSVKQAEWMK